MLVCFMFYKKEQALDSQGVITRRNTLRLGMECSAMFAPNVTTPHEQLSRGSDSAPPNPRARTGCRTTSSGSAQYIGPIT